MALEWLIVDGVITARQRYSSPSVYLDHWAIRHFSQTPADAQRFAEVMNLLDGTLVMSYLNFAEFVPPSAPQYAKMAEPFLDTVVKRMFFSDFNIGPGLEPDPVRPGHFIPPADRELVRLVALNPSTSLEGFSFAGIVSAVAASPQLGLSAQAMKARIAAHICSLRRKKEFRDTVLNHIPVIGQPVMAIVLGELMRPYLDSEVMRFSENDASDLQHAAVPSICCDFVLLDRHWVARVEEMRARLLGWGQTLPIAETFSPRPGEVTRFLGVLESFR